MIVTGFLVKRSGACCSVIGLAPSSAKTQSPSGPFLREGVCHFAVETGRTKTGLESSQGAAIQKPAAMRHPLPAGCR